MANGRGALSGAATGAAAGASFGSLFPGFGTAIGGGIGALLGGIAGARSKKHNASELTEEQLERLRQILPQLQQRALGNPLETTSARARQGLLNESIERQAGLDASLAGGLGMGSSSFAIGQGANRLRAAVQGTRQNAGVALGDQSVAIGQLLAALGQGGALAGSADQARNQAVGIQGANLSGALQALTQISQKRSQ